MDTTPRHGNPAKISQEFRYLFLSSRNRRFERSMSITYTIITRVTEIDIYAYTWNFPQSARITFKRPGIGVEHAFRRYSRNQPPLPR